MLEGVWEGRRSHTYILGMSENIYILARGKGWDYENSAYRLAFYSPVFLDIDIISRYRYIYYTYSY